MKLNPLEQLLCDMINRGACMDSLPMHQVAPIYESLQDYGILDEDFKLTDKYKKKVDPRAVLEYFNHVNHTKFRSGIDKLNVLCRYFSMEQFESVIHHKAETWGREPKMKEYNRPATLFASKSRFEAYLDDATMYWTDKAKKSLTI